MVVVEVGWGFTKSTAELANLFQERMIMLRDRTDIVNQLRPLRTANLPDLEAVLPSPGWFAELTAAWTTTRFLRCCCST